MMLLVPNCPYVHVSKLVPWCDDTSALVSWYVVPQMLTTGKLACTSADHRCACLLVSKLKHFLAKKTFGNSCIYVMSTLCNFLWLIFLFMSAGSESSNWLELVMFKNDFVKTSRYLFGRSHLGFERFNYFDLTNFSSFCIWNFSNNSHPPMELQNFSR